MRLRTREIGIRLALGGRPAGIVRTLLGRTAWTALGGLAFGVGAALALRPFLAVAPFFLPPSEPLVYAGVSVLFAAVGACAAIVPVQRTLRADPLKALRHD